MPQTACNTQLLIFCDYSIFVQQGPCLCFKHIIQKSGFQDAAGSKLLIYSVSWQLKRLSSVKNNGAYLCCGLQGTLSIKAFIAGSTKRVALMSFKITLECNKNQSFLNAFLARSALCLELWLKNSKTSQFSDKNLLS